MLLALLLGLCLLAGCGGKEEPREPESTTLTMDEIVNYTGLDGDISALEEDALIDYLLANVEEAYERVYEMRGPLGAKVPGDTTDLPDEADCRDVLLETVFGETIIRYTIAPSGAIYEYFPDDDTWGLIYVPGAVG